MTDNSYNSTPEEIDKFSSLAKEWWKPDGPMKPLHLLNPLRIEYIARFIKFPHKKILDVGCGGGILTEGLARKEAIMTGIDLSKNAIEVAKQHASKQQLNIEYRCVDVGSIADEQPNTFDAVTCLELLEHVNDPSAIIKACHACVKPGGYVFFSTINRTMKSFLTAIVGAEYLLQLLPRGTHEYSKLIRPSELHRWASASHLSLISLQGVEYQVFTKSFAFCQDVAVNYLACYQKPE